MLANAFAFAAFAPLALAVTAPAAAAPIADADAFPASKIERADQPNQRYCIVTDVTGSRITRKHCQSLALWQDQGIDPRLLPRRR